VPEALAEALVKLANDKDLRFSLGQAARRRIEERFSLESCVRRYQNLYRGRKLGSVPVQNIIEAQQLRSRNVNPAWVTVALVDKARGNVRLASVTWPQDNRRLIRLHHSPSRPSKFGVSQLKKGMRRQSVGVI
jgi:hypothetical protein